jgi:hypothetical protein
VLNVKIYALDCPQKLPIFEVIFEIAAFPNLFNQPSSPFTNERIAMQNRLLGASSPRFARSLCVFLISFLSVAVTLSYPVANVVRAVDGVVFVGAGDIALCGSPMDEETARLIDAIPGEVFAAGDNVYQTGTAENYAKCFGSSWGRFKDRIHPALGNHDYAGGNANAYFDYFGERAGPRGKGYYSFDYGGWHIVVLNSNPFRDLLVEQEGWLRADLAAHPATCTLAISHNPVFSSGAGGVTTYSRAFFQILYEAGADILISGDNHQYERFAPSNLHGQHEPKRGIRQFVVGTGGASLNPFGKIWGNTEARFAAHGVLKLTLGAGSYAWEFIPIAGSEKYRDAGESACVSP